MATSVIRNFIAKALFKKKGAIANKKAVEFSANALEQRLINIGIDPDSIRSEQELNQILNLVKQAEDQAFNQRFGDVLSRSNLDRKGEVFDMTGKKDKLINQLNKTTEKQRKKFTKGDKITEEPKALDFYTDIMVSDFEKKTGPYFEREKKRLKKLKGKK